jgi:hypothetical protein
MVPPLAWHAGCPSMGGDDEHPAILEVHQPTLVVEHTRDAPIAVNRAS